MSLTETTYLVVGASFALYILIAIRSRAGSTQEFYCLLYTSPSPRDGW